MKFRKTTGKSHRPRHQHQVAEQDNNRTQRQNTSKLQTTQPKLFSTDHFSSSLKAAGCDPSCGNEHPCKVNAII
jgi:hypothetical protein